MSLSSELPYVLANQSEQILAANYGMTEALFVKISSKASTRRVYNSSCSLWKYFPLTLVFIESLYFFKKMICFLPNKMHS